MRTAMQSLEGMIDVNTVVGDAVETREGTVIVPVSQVSFGFVAGGGEYGVAKRGDEPGLPFGGGSGAGVSVRPIAFLVVQRGSVRLLPVDQRASLERLLDLAPELLDRILGTTEARHKAATNGRVTPGTTPADPQPQPASNPAGD